MDINLELAKNERMETPRLILRKIELSDAKDLFEYMNDEKVAAMSGMKSKENILSVEKSIAHWFIPERLIIWGLEDKESHRIIGQIELHIDGGQAELGWMLNASFWGLGLMPEACQHLIRFAFKNLKLQVLTAKCHIENHNSIRVMEKCGMKKYGQVFDTISGELVLSEYYALKQDEMKISQNKREDFSEQ